jgi:hypothetical protein
MNQTEQFSPWEIFPTGKNARLRVRGERGLALMHALLLVALVMMTVGAMLSRTEVLVRGTMLERGELGALYAAEGGLARARHELRRDGGFAGGEFQLGQCDVIVAVRKVRDGQWAITATGISYPGGRRGNPVQVSLSAGFGAESWYRRSGTR